MLFWAPSPLCHAMKQYINLKNPTSQLHNDFSKNELKLKSKSRPPYIYKGNMSAWTYNSDYKGIFAVFEEIYYFFCIQIWDFCQIMEESYIFPLRNGQVLITPFPKIFVTVHVFHRLPAYTSTVTCLLNGPLWVVKAPYDQNYASWKNY